MCCTHHTGESPLAGFRKQYTLVSHNLSPLFDLSVLLQCLIERNRVILVNHVSDELCPEKRYVIFCQIESWQKTHAIAMGCNAILSASRSPECRLVGREDHV